MLEKDTGYCDRELVKNDFGDFRWPEVVEGVEIFLDCGVGPEGSEARTIILYQWSSDAMFSIIAQFLFQYRNGLILHSFIN